MDQNSKEVIRFIDRLYRDLYLSKEVLHHSTGHQTDKLRNVREYLDMLKDMHERASLTDSRKEILKRLYHDKHVIKLHEIPDSYYELQKKIALERGMGHLILGESEKEEMGERVINDQTKSLDAWLDYFLSDDAKIYPFWVKYWAFQGMLKLGTFNKEKGTFNKRSKDTVAPFVDLNREALALSMDLIIKVVKKEEITDKDLELLAKSGSFEKIYTYMLNHVLKKNDPTKRNEGIWIKYDQGSDHMPLVKSLQGYNTGWCTAGEAVAKSQLEGGDFYVYYTLDENGEYKVPRIAIRMEGNRIGEIRGVSTGQNIEAEMENVVEEKIKDFPDKEKYYRKVDNMKKLTEIYNKQHSGIELTEEELRFLYEIDDVINGFGYQKDPRISEILANRDVKSDISKVLNCTEDEIAMSKREMDANTKVYYGNLKISRKNIKNISSLEFVFGDLELDKLSNVDRLVLPKTVSGKVDLSCIKTANELILPERIGGVLDLYNINQVNTLVFPKAIEGDLNLDSLMSFNNLILPKTVGGDLNLYNLTNADNVVFPKTVENHLVAQNLTSANHAVFPESVGDNLYLGNLTSAIGTIFPKIIGGCLSIMSLTNVDDLVLPEVINGDLFLGEIDDLEKITFPEKVRHIIVGEEVYDSVLDLKNAKEGKNK